MSKVKEKPFYAKPPLNILFELSKLRYTRLWEIKIAYLLKLFLAEMENLELPDFRASGIALDSSAHIYLMKAKLLLKLEEPPPPPPQPPQDFVPQPLPMPVRYELTSTTLKNLLEALDEALEMEKMIVHRKPREVLPPPPEFLPPLDRFLLEIERNMDLIFNKLLEYSLRGEVASFDKLIKGLSRVDAIKVFIILLFLAQRGKITLWQDPNSETLYITVSKTLEEEA